MRLGALRVGKVVSGAGNGFWVGSLGFLGAAAAGPEQLQLAARVAFRLLRLLLSF